MVENFKKLMTALNLIKEVEGNPEVLNSLILALKRSGKTAVAAGVGYGLLVFVGALQADATSGIAVALIFKLVSAQAVVAAISKYLKEHYGVTLPL